MPEPGERSAVLGIWYSSTPPILATKDRISAVAHDLVNENEFVMIIIIVSVVVAVILIIAAIGTPCDRVL